MTIASQNSLILEIIKTLKCNSSGIGIRLLYDIKIKRNGENAQITFTPKIGREINPIEFFYLGLHIDWYNLK